MKERMKYSRKKLNMVFCVLTAVLIVFIWANSMRDGDESYAQSGVFVNAVKGFLGLFGFEPSVSSVSYAVRKAAHMTEFAALAFISSIAAQSGLIKIPKWRFKLVYPLFCSLLVASVDEFIQIFSDGRSSDVRDVLIDFCGAIIGTLAATAALTVYRRRMKKQKKSGFFE